MLEKIAPMYYLLLRYHGKMESKKRFCVEGGSMVKLETEKQGPWNQGTTATDEWAPLRECFKELHSLLKELAHAGILPAEEAGAETGELSGQLHALMGRIESAQEAAQRAAQWRLQAPQAGAAPDETITLCKNQFDAAELAWSTCRQAMDSWCRKQGAEAAYHSAFEKYAGTLEEKWNLLASKFDAFYGQIQADASRSEGPYRALEVYAPPEKRMGQSNTGTHGQTYPFLHADPDASPPPIAPIYASPPFPLEKSKKDGFFKRLFRKRQGR